MPNNNASNRRASFAWVLSALVFGPMGWIGAYYAPRNWTGWPLLAIGIFAIALLVISFDGRFIKNRPVEKMIDILVGVSATLGEYYVLTRHSFGWANVAWVFGAAAVLLFGARMFGSTRSGFKPARP